MKRPDKFPAFSAGVSPILMMNYHRECAFGFGVKPSGVIAPEHVERFVADLTESYGECIIPQVLQLLQRDGATGFSRYSPGVSVIADFFECEFDGEMHIGEIVPGMRFEFFGIGNVRDWYELHLKVWLGSGDDLSARLRSNLAG